MQGCADPITGTQRTSGDRFKSRERFVRLFRMYEALSVASRFDWRSERERNGEEGKFTARMAFAFFLEASLIKNLP